MDFNDNALKVGQLRLNYSKLSVGKQCPFRFTKQYLEKHEPTNQTDSSSAQIGIIVHAIMEKAVEEFTKVGHAISLENVRSVMSNSYEKALAKYPATSTEKEAVLSFEAAVEAMLNRILSFKEKTKSIVYTEIGLAIDPQFNPLSFFSKEGVFFNGKLDLILVTPQGRVAIIDHKTGFKTARGHEDQLRAYEVLVAYALAPIVKSQHGIDITSVQTGLNFIADEEIIWSQPVTIDEVRSRGRERFVAWVNKISDDITVGEVRRGNHCKWCGYRSFCGSKVGQKAKKEAVSVSL